MGKILSFQPRGTAQKRQPIAKSAPASVIIFPGVRYEQLPLADAGLLTRRIGDLMPRLPTPQRP